MTNDLPIGPLVAPPNASAPDGRVLSGRYCRLEKLDPASHGAGLWDCAASEPYDRWLYLGDYEPGDSEQFAADLVLKQASPDPYFYAILPNGQGAQGWASFMRMDVPNASIEIGWIWLSARMNRTRASTEGLSLMMRHAFDDLGMRRLEWKCNALNAPSRRTAERLGFTYEGTFRQHQITRGRNRDTAWYSVIDREWPKLRAAFDAWLAPENFDAEGRQIQRLEDIRGAA